MTVAFHTGHLAKVLCCLTSIPTPPSPSHSISAASAYITTLSNAAEWYKYQGSYKLGSIVLDSTSNGSKAQQTPVSADPRVCPVLRRKQECNVRHTSVPGLARLEWEPPYFDHRCLQETNPIICLANDYLSTELVDFSWAQQKGSRCNPVLLRTVGLFSTSSVKAIGRPAETTPHQPRLWHGNVQQRFVSVHGHILFVFFNPAPISLSPSLSSTPPFESKFPN
ncbi:hypothetical protein ACRALDRAFT_206398 [Sodiomyces alcalophilus JCM 7366]|uniref:uncharacterized protein n=1 Tax=Sodiomyces alcalophilus JCM 7366 TaxID=591952 RepID=UPI0039B4A956